MVLYQLVTYFRQFNYNEILITCCIPVNLVQNDESFVFKYGRQ